jgi:hypothetical protein
VAQTSACSSSILPLYPLFVSIRSSSFILRLLSTFKSLLPWRSSRAAPPRAVSSRTILWPALSRVSFSGFFSSSSPVVRTQCASMRRAYCILIRCAAARRCVHLIAFLLGFDLPLWAASAARRHWVRLSMRLGRYTRESAAGAGGRERGECGEVVSAAVSHGTFV